MSDFTSTPGLAQQADYLISTAQVEEKIYFINIVFECSEMTFFWPVIQHFCSPKKIHERGAISSLRKAWEIFWKSSIASTKNVILTHLGVISPILVSVPKKMGGGDVRFN